MVEISVVTYEITRLVFVLEIPVLSFRDDQVNFSLQNDVFLKNKTKREKSWADHDIRQLYSFFFHWFKMIYLDKVDYFIR
jgi:hypothetical protein